MHENLWKKCLGVGSIILLVTGCMSSTIPSITLPSLPPLPEQKEFIPATETIKLSDKELVKSTDTCVTEVPKPTAIFLDEKFEVVEPSKAKYIVYEVQEHAKINEKLLQLRHCAQLFDNLQEKYNILVNYIGLYHQASALDLEYQKRVLLIEKQRVTLYVAYAESYKGLLSEKERKNIYERIENIIKGATTSLLIIGIIAAVH